MFKGWLRELGERKRAEAEKAEQRFVEMLKADKDIKEGDKWAEVIHDHRLCFKTALMVGRTGQDSSRLGSSLLSSQLVFTPRVPLHKARRISVWCWSQLWQ